MTGTGEPHLALAGSDAAIEVLGEPGHPVLGCEVEPESADRDEQKAEEIAPAAGRDQRRHPGPGSLPHEVRGYLTSIQTFGSFAANFNPHCHCLVTEGAFTPQGDFLALPTSVTHILGDIEERFRKLLLKRLHQAERLSEAFMNKLLEWNPSRFSVHAEQLVYDDQSHSASSFDGKHRFRLGRSRLDSCNLSTDP